MVRVEKASFATVVKRSSCGPIPDAQIAADFFESRVAAGRIVDGHGDLRPEHIYLLPEPVIIDCIEFSQELRQVDIADELSFFARSATSSTRRRRAAALPRACFESLGDHPPTELLAFYRSYRACVRAKVAVLRSRQLEGEPAALATQPGIPSS